ncbi:HNH endonuclease [Micromonospora sp. NPDC005299]|uniref:HNH endonuclease n=1 Tax=Micromonospora sp. NPDC005299 TaxID=3364231 RepID=UPI0036AC4769
MSSDVDSQSRLDRLMASPYYEAVVAANRSYLNVAVPDAAELEREHWALSCLPNTRTITRRLSAVSMKTMETFVLYEPVEPLGEGVAGGFVVVRRSILDRNWPTPRAFASRFPGLTVEESDYVDAGSDQVRVSGRHDDLMAALEDEDFAEAVRDLVGPLLRSRTIHSRGHSYPLADQVLERVSRSAEWIYPVNEQSRAWDDDLGVLEFFQTLPYGDMDDWDLASCFHQIKAGDRIWVYATRPLSRLVGACVAWSDSYEKIDGDARQWRLEIRWDRPLTRFLVRNFIAAADVLTSSVQTVRSMRSAEALSLRKALDGHQAPEPQNLPEGRRRRLAEVTARQGQADFRRRLIEAYGGRCAISGCDVEAVLQAAHIDPYNGPATNRVSNGLLLRADLHNLFDRGLIWIDGSYRVRVVEGLDHYAEWDAQRIQLPPVQHRPDKEALLRHRREVAGDPTA